MKKLGAWSVLRDSGFKPVSAIDVDALAYLLGETVTSSEPLETRQRTVMIGLCNLIGAHGWTVLMRKDKCHGSFQILNASSPVDSMAGHGGDVLSSLPPAKKNKAHLHTNPAGNVLISESSPSSGSSCVVCIFREPGHPPFSRREQQLARILFEEVPWLHATTPGKSDNQPTKANPHRKQQILNLLRQGLDRKGIAEELQISPHTVTDYQKTIYRELGVNNQIALMKNPSPLPSDHA